MQRPDLSEDQVAKKTSRYQGKTTSNYHATNIEPYHVELVLFHIASLDGKVADGTE